jgi:hypothetical protein
MVLMSDERVLAAASRVERAIRDEGRSPGYHLAVMEKHRGEWPTLWHALDELLAALEGNSADVG